MKIIRITFFIAFLSLWSISIFNQKPSSVEPSHPNLLQSPLSDDETNPVNKHFTEVAEFDLEDHKENNSVFTIDRIIPFTYTNILSIPIAADFSTNLFHKQSPLSSFNIQQSFLQVFRI